MASKQVTDRQKSAESVVAVGKAQGKTVASAVREVFERHDTRAPDVEGFVDALASVLRHACDAMVRADAAHEHELSDDRPARELRDELTSSVRTALMDLRSVVEGLYGAKAARTLLPTTTPVDPVMLARVADEAVAALTSASLPPPRVAGASFDARSAVAPLVERRAELGRALEAVAREAREADVTLAAKHAATEEYDRVFRGVATILEGCFLLAGKKELAEKVRPSGRRPGMTAEDAESTGALTPSS